MEQDLEWLRIGCHNDKLGNTTVERLGDLVGTLLQLLVVGCLLDQIHDRVGESGIGKGPGFIGFGLQTTIKIATRQKGGQDPS